MLQNQQPGEDTRTAITELQTELDDIKRGKDQNGICYRR